MLVNNAGLSRGLDKLYQGKIEDWEEMIDTNVKGLLYVTRAVVPGMVERGRGHVVNLGSTAGELTYPNGAVYCASKAAERAINDGLRQDVLGTPGPRHHRRSRHGRDRLQPGALPRRCRSGPPRSTRGSSRLPPEDMADAIVWAVGRPQHVNIARVSTDPGAAGQLPALSPRALTGMRSRLQSRGQ